MLPRPEFEHLWHSLPSAGRFDARLTSSRLLPSVAQLSLHLESPTVGFQVVAAGERAATHGGGKQLFFCGAAPFKSAGTATFLGELVLHDRDLLCEYRCTHPEICAAFVQQLQLGRIVTRVA